MPEVSKGAKVRFRHVASFRNHLRSAHRLARVVGEVGNGFKNLCSVRELTILLTNRWSTRREPSINKLGACKPTFAVGSKTRA